LPGVLPAAAEILRRRLPQRRGEIGGRMDKVIPPPIPSDEPRAAFRGAPTIRDVARIAEVSIGTASKALNAGGRLRQETRDKVLHVARQIGHQPNTPAPSLTPV